MDNLFKHRDFYLCAFLMVNNCKLIAHKKQNGLTTFVFNDDQRLRGLIKDFYSMNGTVDALAYSSVIRSLKSVIHATDSKAYTKVSNSHEFENNFESKV